MKTLDGNVVIVAGGRSGIGVAAALQFAREGVAVLKVLDRQVVTCL